MIDARMAANMLLMLEPKRVEARVVLEVEAELQAIIQAAQQPVAVSAPVPAAAQEPLPDGNDDHKEPAAAPAGGG